MTIAPQASIVNGLGTPPVGVSGCGDMASLREPVRCDGTRKGHSCGGQTFKCSNPECGSVGCEKSGCDHRQFMPIQKCKDCGRSYERIQQFEVSKTHSVDEGASSTAPGVRVRLPNIELLFGGILGLVALAAALAGLMGVFGGGNSISGSSSGVAAPQISASLPNTTTTAYTDICQCYREGMSLAGTGISVLSSQYRTGFIQCRAVFGPQGGDAWTAGWTAREKGKLIGAGCRSWMRSVGR